MAITKIVLTGGPCAGKTTALVKIIEHFSSLGYQVLTLPEVATMFSTAGVNFSTSDKQLFFQMERAALEMQLDMENRFAEMAEHYDKPVIIIFDRGTMDISAYVSADVWQAIQNELGTNTVALRDARYDAVIHLVTAANGAEKFYSNANNQYRRENLEQARELDAKLIAAWTGHPHLRVIGNQQDFDTKLRMVLKEISNIIGVPEPIEAERKYIVNLVGEIPNAVESEITQTYLISGNDSEIRVRKRGAQGCYVYFHTIKKALSPTERVETEKKISPREYIAFLEQADPNYHPIRKNRKCFVWKNQYFELDTYLSPNPGLQILELEGVNSHEEIDFPPFIKVVEDVTGNKKYYNHQLAKI